MSEKRHFEFRYSGTTAERTVFSPTAVPMYWWDTDLAVLFVWDGTAWRRLGGINWDNVIIVDPGGNGDYTTITAAEAAASDGDLILVVPGTYAEALDLGSTAVTIAAITPGTVILDASGQADYAVNFSGTKDVHLYGLIVTPAATHAGIYSAGGAYSGTATLTRVVVGDPGAPASISLASGTLVLDMVTAEGGVNFYGTVIGSGLGNTFEDNIYITATASYASKLDIFEGNIGADAGAAMTWQGSICLGTIDSDLTITYDSPVIEGGDVGIGAVPGTQLEQAGTAPYHTFWNTTEEDADGGRESRLIFEGEQSGGEHTALGWIEACHDGSADDEKGRLAFYVNDGSDGDSPTEQARINAAGDVLTPRRSMVRAYRSVAQSIPNNTITIVQYNTENWDTQAEWDSAVNYRFQPLEDGYFRVSASLLFDTTATLSGTENVSLRVYRNGGLWAYLDRKDNFDGTDEYVMVHGTTSVYLTTSDYIDIRVYQNSGGALNTFANASYNYVDINRIG